MLPFSKQRDQLFPRQKLIQTNSLDTLCFSSYHVFIFDDWRSLQ